MARRMKDKSNAARFHRLQRNPSQDFKVHRTTITVTGQLNSAAAATNASVTMPDVKAAVDYVAFTGLYRTYRIVGMEFQIFDLQPGTPVASVVGTIHSGGSLPALGVGLVQDCLDSTNIVPYRQHHFYWIASQPFEKLFFDTSVANDFGGLVFHSAGGTAVTAKWRYMVRAIVEFRDRL